MNSNSNNKTSNQMKDILENIKADYFLQQLFGNLGRKKILELIKYNNNIKRRINININDYKEYSELYTSIEVEIIPKINEYGEFIDVDIELLDFQIRFKRSLRPLVGVRNIVAVHDLFSSDLTNF